MSVATPSSMVVTLEFARAEQADDPFAFRFRPQTYLVRSAGGGFTTIELGWSTELVADLSAVRQPSRDPAVVQRIGETLRRFLASSSWPQQEARIVAAVQANQSVLLTIRSAAAELYALPWELLTIKASGQHLGELPSLILRYEWPETLATPLPTQHREGPGRILFAWSASGGAVPAAEHRLAIESACQRGCVPFESARDVLPHASAGKLVAMFHAAKKEGAGIAVLHLLCHGTAAGTTFGLALDGEGAGDRAAVLDAGRLRQMLAPFSDMLRLVVVSACDSGNLGEFGNQLGSIAQTLHRAGIAQVVASRYPLSVAGSVCFAETFYRELLVAPQSVEQSLLQARRELATASLQLDWASLQLYAHSAAGEDSRPIVFRPYRGLLAFLPEHRRFFFGRDQEVAELVADFIALGERKQPRLLAIDGASGTGKSSVLFAGALPQLLAVLGPDATLLRMRPGSAPEQTLTAALAGRADAGTDRSPALLIIDQFEELFTHVQDANLRQSFARRVWRLAADPESRISVILTVRSDFVGRCGELVLDDTGLRFDRVLYDEGHRVSVAQMNRQQMRAVIEKPAERVGLRLESGLSERMLSDVDSEPGALPLLAHTLDLLWQRRVGNTLTQAAYDAIGGVAGALHGRAEDLMRALSAGEQQQARRLLVRLGSGLSDISQGVRLRVSVSSRQPHDPAQRGHFEQALSRLVDARLLVLDLDGKDQTVEVAHEALLRKWPRLHEWVREDRQLLVQVEIVEAWTRESMQSTTLLSADRLSYAEKVDKDFPEALSSAAKKVVESSRKAQDLVEVRDRFARDSLRMLGVQAFQHDPTRQAAILREAESADPTEVPGWLSTTLAILHSHVLSVAELCGHTNAVGHVDISPDGARVVSGSGDCTARVWSLTGAAEPIILSGHTDAVGWCGFSPDGRSIVTCSDDRTVRIFAADGRAPPRVLVGHRAAVWQAAWSPDGSRIATASEDGTARVWRIASPENPLVLSGHEDAVLEVAWSADGKRLATASADGTARVWSLAGRDAPLVLSGHEHGVTSVQFDPRGSRVLTASMDGTARLFPLSGRGAPTVLERPPSKISFARISPDGQRIALCGEYGDMYICDAAGRDDFIAHAGEDARLSSIAWISDSQLVATFEDGLVLLVPADRIAPPRSLRGHRSQVNGIAYSAGRRLLVTASLDGTPRVWDMARAEQSAAVFDPAEEAHFLFCPGPEGPFAQEATSADGCLRATVTPDHCVRIDKTDGSAPVRLQGHTDEIRCVRFSPDGRRVVTGSKDWQARIWNSDGSGAPVTLVGHQHPVHLAIFTTDGRKVFTVDSAGVLFIWDERGRGEALWQGHRVVTVAIAADCKRVVCKHEDEEAERVFDLDPAGLRERLWQASPLCLSIEDRERYLREPRDLALHNHQNSRASIRR